MGNKNGGTVEVVYLTTQPKTDLPTHCTIRSTGRISTVLCEQVHTVSIERVGKYIGQCTDVEMRNIDIAIMISLSLDAGIKTSKQYNETIERQQETIESLKAEIEIESMKKEKAENEAVEQSRNSAETAGEEIIRTRTERDTYKALYESLFERMIAS
jgi:mRNA interferase MazF